MAWWRKATSWAAVEGGSTHDIQKALAQLECKGKGRGAYWMLVQAVMCRRRDCDGDIDTIEPDLSQLKCALAEKPNTSIDHFAHYLRGLLHDMMSDSNFSTYPPALPCFAERCVYFAQLLSKAPDSHVAAFHTSVQCMSILQRMRKQCVDFNSFHRELYLNEQQQIEHQLHLLEVGFPEVQQKMLIWSKRPGNPYVNLAQARRHLWSAITAVQDCRHTPLRADSKHPPCWRRKHYDLLERLQIGAWSETRSKVTLLVGRRLPAELAEIVFEQALIAEDIPADPRVWSYKARSKTLKEEFVCGVSTEFGAY